MEIEKLSEKTISRVFNELKKGKIIIFPTDTVYGFLVLAENKKAVEKIFKIKKRPKSKALPIFVKDLKMAKELAEISSAQEKIIRKNWPGKYTFILKSKIKNQKSKLFLKNGKIALRVPKYKFLNDLLKEINKPLAQTSANISKCPATTKISEVVKYFKNKKYQPDLTIDAGNLPKSKPSKIIDLTSERLIRIR